MRLKPRDKIAEIRKRNEESIRRILEEEKAKSWDNYEPAPIEFFHAELTNLFHEFRKERGTTSFHVSMNGIDFNNLIAKAKTKTYEKYQKLNLERVIHKSELK
ncbi:MAG: hypothetical protein JNL70_18970 [Saprospiraceae bacterium]|nr:hypothetical protein [Saprospiraceae bacterium]